VFCEGQRATKYLLLYILGFDLEDPFLSNQ